MSASATATDSYNALEDLVQDVFDEHITNDIPIHLLHITKHDQKIRFKLVDREFVREHFKSVPKNIHAEFTETVMLVDEEDREDRIKERVKEELKYAIFSHRWSQGEPLYYHMSKEPMEVSDDPRPGWKNLERFCCTAKDDHDCEFAWSDTCCIDKTSSAELDESINSMFRWYRNSYICIALLSETADLAALRMQEKGGSGEKAMIDAWFVRGWTLQELLAPSQIKFYGADWEPLIQGSTNDKDDGVIMRKISELTDVPMDDLRSFTPCTDRVPEKMLWASRRRTTRIEDIAYCLIGIFDISLVIIYGEGNKAFFRLMAEILKRYDKWDVFLWSGRCSRYNVALPNAPHSYAAESIEISRNAAIQATSHEIGDRRFTLTNHGLEIRVLLLPVELENTSEELSDSRCLWFGHDYFRVKATHIGPKPGNKSWAIGVLDYGVDGEEGYIDRFRGTPTTVFLLSSNADASPHLAATTKWKKEMTKDIVRINVLAHIQERLTLLHL